MGNPLENATVYKIDVGDRVICDSCSEEYTGKPDSGGILFQSKAICPKCEKEWTDGAVKYGEENLIRARCPEGKPFAKWVVEDLR